jgi:hypothetical protein
VQVTNGFGVEIFIYLHKACVTGYSRGSNYSLEEETVGGKVEDRVGKFNGYSKVITDIGAQVCKRRKTVRS